ncbi:queuosine salvage protein [Episyrphus balteatus]|uniref:queuosine salvage protein n=1 Tax=Episyrphus balteatus TaxID=286459 RepID=UPI0024851E6D|nr:queuosine salvage protein [Episyrphus balteatus]
MSGYLENISQFAKIRHDWLMAGLDNEDPDSKMRKDYLAAKPLSPRESGEFIVQNAKYIKVHQSGIDKLTEIIIKGIQSKEIDVSNFSQHELHPKPTDKHAANWILVVDTLNYCFWTPTNYTKYKVNGYTGYFALCAAINRAMEEGIPITDPHYYSKIDQTTLEYILRSDDGETCIPLLRNRVDCLQEVGKILVAVYDANFEKMIKLAKKSAEKLLELIVGEFICFRDTAHFEKKYVSLYKRAQILVGDIWSCFGGKGLGEFHDIGKITMFADYRVPQVLVHFGALEYTDELMEVLKKDTILENGDRMEVEIRGASINIVERVKDAVLLDLMKNHPELSKDNVNSILIDQYLWDYRRQHAEELENIPFHKVENIYY